MTEERLNPLQWLQSKFASLVHTHTKSDITDLGTIPSTSSTITDSNTYSNIGNTAQTQESINGAINTKLGELVDIHLVQYELSSSDYSPHVGSTVTITCTCKDILGNPIPNKELELMLNGGSIGTSTTNENGIATWSNTFGSEGVKDHYIGNSHCIIVVNGYHKIYDSNGLKWYVNRLTGISHIILNRNGVSINKGGFTTLKSAYSSTDSKVDYCPYTTHMIPTQQSDVFLMVDYLGEIKLYNFRSTSISNGSFQMNTTFLGKAYIVD